MGQKSQHPGHKAEAWEKIERAREHYATRAARRKRQVWAVGPRDGKRKVAKGQSSTTG